jgi:hypothetical protein
MSKDLAQQDADFFDRARRNPLRVVDFEYALEQLHMLRDVVTAYDDSPEVEDTLP